MIRRSDLSQWIMDALAETSPLAVPEVAKHIWEHHKADFEKAERERDVLFYTWQYAMRWEAQKLQHAGKLAKKVKGRLWAKA